MNFLSTKDVGTQALTQVKLAYMNKNRWFLLVVVVLVALGYWLMGKQSRVANDVSYSSPTPTSSPAPRAPSSGGAKASPASAPVMSYTELVREYEGRRIQFDQYCQAFPSNITYKNGTSIMLDNRSGDARHIKVGDDVYSLPGYGYRVVTLTSQSLPSDILISCGSAVNVGKILLQASLNQ